MTLQSGFAMRRLRRACASARGVGKCMEIEAEALDEAQLHAICRDLLSNPVIEDYALEIEEPHA